MAESALSEALAYGNDIADVQNAKALAALREAGVTRVHELGAPQFSLMRQAVAPVHTALAQRIGAHWLVDAHEAIKSG